MKKFILTLFLIIIIGAGCVEPQEETCDIGYYFDGTVACSGEQYEVIACLGANDKGNVVFRKIDDDSGQFYKPASDCENIEYGSVCGFKMEKYNK